MIMVITLISNDYGEMATMILMKRMFIIWQFHVRTQLPGKENTRNTEMNQKTGCVDDGQDNL